MQVGIDTVEIKRIESLVQNKERFLERVFSEKEQEEFIKRNNKTEQNLNGKLSKILFFLIFLHFYRKKYHLGYNKKKK